MRCTKALLVAAALGAARCDLCGFSRAVVLRGRWSVSLGVKWGSEAGSVQEVISKEL